MDVPANRSGGADRESEQSRRAVDARARWVGVGWLRQVRAWPGLVAATCKPCSGRRGRSPRSLRSLPAFASKQARSRTAAVRWIPEPSEVATSPTACCVLQVPSEAPVRPSLPASFQAPFFFTRTMQMGRAAPLASCAHRTMHRASISVCVRALLFPFPLGPAPPSSAYLAGAYAVSGGLTRRAASVGSW